MAPYHALDSHGLPKQSCKAGSETLSVSKDSHNVGKPAGGGVTPPYRRDWQAGGTTMQAPTIRVIHIFAPKVIKTDVANFRSTVQKLTGRSKKSQRRAARSKTVSDSGVANPGTLTTAPSQGGASFTGVWDQETSQKEVLQRLVGDACGADDLVRSNSLESTYSLDSGNFSSDSNTSNDTDLPSPTDSFSFYVPQRDTAYSLSEIPAPFFGDMHPSYSTGVTSPSIFSHPTSHGSAGILDNGLQLPSVMDSTLSMLSFDVDIGSGLGSPLPLSDISFPPLGTTSSGGLFDLVSVQQHCRLSVQQPFQGANFFEI